MLRALWADHVELQVEIALGLPGDLIFTLDDPVQSQLDANMMLGSVDGQYDDVTCDVRSLTWRTGATRGDGILTRWEAASCSIVLDNRDAQYDPTQQPARLLPMIRVRIRARRVPNDGTTPWLPMFMGYADAWAMVWDEQHDATVVLTASGGTKLLSAYNAPELTSAVGGGETAAQRATRILNEAEWSDPRNITAGGTLRMSTTMADDAWTQLLLNQDAELGETYIDTDGTFVFIPRSLWIANVSDPNATVVRWGPNDLRYESAIVTNDDTNLRNIVDCARPGGTAQTVRNDQSVAQYQPHRYGRMDLPFTNDGDAMDWANLVMQTCSTPTQRIEQLEVLPQTSPDDLWDAILNVSYAQHWQVTVDAPGMASPLTHPVQVRGWEHVVDNESWRITYTLSEATIWQGFRLDDPDPNATLDVMRLI